MGIETVGVYSEPDRNALHVDAVDVAVALGGSTPGRVVPARRRDASPPRSTPGATPSIPATASSPRTPRSPQAVIDAGLIWVGPTPEQIALLGDKVAAKKAAIEAGVPTTPIHEVSAGRDPDRRSRCPVLVKAAAGGGGRGMRDRARRVGELAAARSSRRRARRESAFGDGTVFVEPYIEHGRHVEVQIMGDRHGNVVHFGERECSIQRRNQKVIEEAPSPGISDDDPRRRCCDGALALARHVGYENAGTVEFLVGDDGTINFLEVNTRLQVEHPVTEAVYRRRPRRAAAPRRRRRAAAVDAGRRSSMRRRSAIEVRLVAEDPAAGWLPVDRRRSPASTIGDRVRVDTGVARRRRSCRPTTTRCSPR